MAKYGMGYKRDSLDERDIMHAPRYSAKQIAREASWERYMRPEPFDQGQQGSCTGQSSSGALIILLNRVNYQFPHVPSRSFIYYNARVIEKCESEDSGAMIRDVFKGMATYGVCPEDSNPKWSFPYDPANFTRKPPEECYENGKRFHTLLQYERVPITADRFRLSLMEGPVVFGMLLHESFESERVAKTGKVPVPRSHESRIGGHAMLAYGYDRRDVFVRNSWGPDWGMKGNCRIPWDVILKDGSDAWQPQLLGGAQ